MADLGEIVEEFRTVEGNDPGRKDGGDSMRRSNTKRTRSRKRRNSDGSQVSAQPSTQGQGHEERREVNKSDGRGIRQQADDDKQDIPLTQDDHQVRFYADYRKVADEYDKEFLKKYDEDLNTTLIFAGLFSAVTSAFIIEVNSQLQPDSGDETAALLRVLIYQNNSTAFGDNVPALPQWTGPPPTMVHVQAILFASLSVSLLSAFLAMLGKQWLNRYSSADMRGSAVERCQNRQRKLDGIVAWYFDHVMESLPLMLQGALLLLGCALSRYLWNISIIVASVVVGVTSAGLVSYLLIIVAGVASENCPYQTPGSYILRHLGPKFWNATRPARSALRNAWEQSEIAQTVVANTEHYYPWRSRGKIIPFLRDLVLEVPVGFAIDVYHLGRAAIRVLRALPVGTYHLVRSTTHRLYSMYSTLKKRLGQETTSSGFRCISWTLQTSLDKSIRLTASEHLRTMPELTGLDQTLIADCFNVFVGCVSLNNNGLVVIQGLEQLATVSAGCLFRILCHLWVADPTSTVLVDLRRRYTRAFPSKTYFDGLPFYPAIKVVHALAHGLSHRRHFQWDDYKPSIQEHILFARQIAEVARVEYQRVDPVEVPDWTLGFSLHSLCLDPPPPASVVADCLTIVATDLGCDLPTDVSLDGSARVEQVSELIIQKLGSFTSSITLMYFKSEAVATLFPYAVRRAQGGQQEMVDMILRAARVIPPILSSPYIETHIAALFDASSPPSLNRAITLVAPCVSWDGDDQDTKNAVARWAAAVSAVPYSGEVGKAVIMGLFSISSHDSLRSHIPVDVWALLKKRPLPREFLGEAYGIMRPTFRHIRGLRDIEILKSYLLLFWSQWTPLPGDDFTEMETSLREDFCGIEMLRNRDDLIEHLDHIQAQLNQRCGFSLDVVQERKEQYGYLKNVLLEVNEIAMDTLAQSRVTFTCALPLPCP